LREQAWKLALGALRELGGVAKAIVAIVAVLVLMAKPIGRLIYSPVDRLATRQAAVIDSLREQVRQMRRDQQDIARALKKAPPGVLRELRRLRRSQDSLLSMTAQQATERRLARYFPPGVVTDGTGVMYDSLSHRFFRLASEEEIDGGHPAVGHQPARAVSAHHGRRADS
jgi:hypothetical protein